MDSSTNTVYVNLLDEGTDVIRPVSALRLGDNEYKLIESDNYNPEFENWEFLPGSRVRCEWRKYGSELVLVAVASVVV